MSAASSRSGQAVALQSFGFGDQLVRVVERSDVAWFVANDVCAVLEIANPRNATARLEEDERDCVHITDAMGRERETTIVSESGVFALIFRSRKPAARTFRKWVTSEVLPAIRRTGRFEAQPANDTGFEPLQGLPTSPDEFEQLRVRLQMVREARIAFGAKAARKLWILAGLPDLSEPNGVDQLMADRFPSIARWFEARAVLDQKSRVPAQLLWADYQRWCAADAPGEMHTQAALGRFLNALGTISFKDSAGRKVRMGVALTA